MRKHLRNNAGFTMVELLITITVAAVVTIAASSLLLLGTRIQHASTEDAKEQQTVRIVLTLLEDMATGGEITEISTSWDGWQLIGKDGEEEKVLFEYTVADQTVYTGEAGSGTALLTGLSSSDVSLNEAGNLLSFSFDTARGGSYDTAVCCRVKPDASTEVNVDDVVSSAESNALKEAAGDEAALRLAFLKTLASQYAGGKNPGVIINGPEIGPYYSEWYIDGYKDGWNKDTPWCACFVSWAAVETELIPKDSNYVFANVDTGMAAFQADNQWKTSGPIPGDYVFFDWDGGNDPAHVGVVLDVVGSYIYTIEGNSSDRVAVRRYPADSDYIIGYGVLPAFNMTTTE